MVGVAADCGDGGIECGEFGGAGAKNDGDNEGEETSGWVFGLSFFTGFTWDEWSLGR